MNKISFAIMISVWLFLNMFAGILVKYSACYHKQIWYLSGLLMLLMLTYFGRALVSMLIGRKYQLSYAYPFLGINYLLSIFVGVLLFRESWSLQRCIGGLVIFIGVLILLKSRNRSEENPSCRH